MPCPTSVSWLTPMSQSPVKIAKIVANQVTLALLLILLTRRRR